MSTDNYLPTGLTGTKVADLLTFSCQHKRFLPLMLQFWKNVETTRRLVHIGLLAKFEFHAQTTNKSCLN